MTTDTSTGRAKSLESGKVPSDASVVFICEPIISRVVQLFIPSLVLGTGK
jgi:hypothetical protein